MDLDNQQRIIYLQYNEFFDNHTSYYSEIRQNKQLFDVSIACEDEIFEAHKVILSASILFFRKVLSQYQQPNPLIYSGLAGFYPLQFYPSGFIRINPANIIQI